MAPLVEQGMVYFGVPPLYRLTASGKKPIYLKTTAALDDFFFDDIKKAYTFERDEKPIKKEADHKKIFHSMMDYTRKLEAFSATLRMKPEIVETALLETFDPETFTFGFNKKKVKVDFDEDEANDTLHLRFEYDILDYNDKGLTDKAPFEQYIGDILQELIHEGIARNNLTYTGGVDENRTEDSEQSDS